MQQCIVNRKDLKGLVKNGSVVRYNGEPFFVVDVCYKDENGEGVLIEPYQDSKVKDLAWESVHRKWKKIASTAKGTRYAVVNTLAAWHTAELHEVLGIILKDLDTNQTKGYTFREAWDLVRKHGGTNIEATGEKKGLVSTRVLATKNNLPFLDNPIWAIPALTEQDQPHTTYSKILKEVIQGKIKSLIAFRFRNVRRTKINEEKALNKIVNSDWQEAKYKQLAQVIENATKIVVLTGAGISTESLIPDFRSSRESIWARDMELVDKMNRSYLTKSQEEFWDAYKKLLYLILDDFLPIKSTQTLLKALQYFEPNPGHQFFAELERQGKDITILTQNVDGLHTKAGSSKVIELHGNINKVICPACGKRYELEFAMGQDVPRCNNTDGSKLCRAKLRPDIVLFGDTVSAFDEAVRLVEAADLLIVAGTSLEVSPVNQLPIIAKNKPGMKSVLINNEGMDQKDLFDLVINGEIGPIVSHVQEHMITHA